MSIKLQGIAQRSPMNINLQQEIQDNTVMETILGMQKTIVNLERTIIELQSEIKDMKQPDKASISSDIADCLNAKALDTVRKL